LTGKHIDLGHKRRWQKRRIYRWTLFEKLSREAAKSYISLDVIRKIEQGSRKILYAEELHKIAKALKLSPAEQRAFYALTQDVYSLQIIDNQAVDEAFANAWQHLSTTRQPTYLFNSLYDLVGANVSMMAFHRMTPEKLMAASKTKFGCNLLGFLFAPNAPLRTTAQAAWQRIVEANIRQFRCTSMRYRDTKRFSTLVKELHKLPNFSELWSEMLVNQQDPSSQLRMYKYCHEEYGPIHYGVICTLMPTPHGDLHLATFEAYDGPTYDLFHMISQEYKPPTQIIDWPIAEMA